jgi:hypothetical protein
MNSRSFSTMVAAVARGGSNRLMQINGCRREGPPAARAHAFSGPNHYQTQHRSPTHRRPLMQIKASRGAPHETVVNTVALPMASS